MPKIREYTTAEIQQKFIEEVRQRVEFWDHQVSRDETQADRLSGLAHSILSLIDSGHSDLCSFLLAPRPCREDRVYLKSQGENWFPYNDPDNIKSDIAGSLAGILFSDGWKPSRSRKAGIPLASK